MNAPRIAAVEVRTVRVELPIPVTFGSWTMTHRESAIVRVSTDAGVEGFAFTLTRDGPVAQIVESQIAAHYRGALLATPRVPYFEAKRQNLATLTAGVGLRALSIVDIAVHDAQARALGLSMSQLLGVKGPTAEFWGIVGYPPSAGPERVASDVAQWRQLGAAGVKMPVGTTLEDTQRRIQAAIEAGDGLPVAIDLAWTMGSVDEAESYISRLPEPLAWIEDPFPPGSPQLLGKLKARISPPLAVGDEQGGPSYPEHLLHPPVVDIVRLDATCMGGITGLQGVGHQLQQAGVRSSFHMNARTHAQIAPALGILQPKVELSLPNGGVDPFEESLPALELVDGFVEIPRGWSGLGPIPW